MQKPINRNHDNDEGVSIVISEITDITHAHAMMTAQASHTIASMTRLQQTTNLKPYSDKFNK